MVYTADIQPSGACHWLDGSISVLDRYSSSRRMNNTFDVLSAQFVHLLGISSCAIFTPNIQNLTFHIARNKLASALNADQNKH